MIPAHFFGARVGAKGERCDCCRTPIAAHAPVLVMRNGLLFCSTVCAKAHEAGVTTKPLHLLH